MGTLTAASGFASVSPALSREPSKQKSLETPLFIARAWRSAEHRAVSNKGVSFSLVLTLWGEREGKWQLVGTYHSRRIIFVAADNSPLR